MTFRKHFITLIVTFVVWLVFLLAGLPSDYYQTWSFQAQVWLSVFAFFMIIPIAYIILKMVWQENFVKSSLWCAFYASVPIFIYDYVYAGLLNDLGLSYVFSHWYLTLFYFIVWIEIPSMGFLMNKWRVR